VRITRVVLENIKSYKNATIELPAGTVAIRGKNGAGKSTLVEAIGFALFDALTYTQAQFVREGERIGTVTVSFISALDDREYQVVRRCGGASEWYVYDPAMQDRAAEQRVDVTDFLRRHLRIESDLSLSTLFNDAIGVPQGTFTADFLQTAANRKKKFDVLLQVEDYRTAAEKLLSASRALEKQQDEQDRRIETLVRDTAQLDAKRAEFEDGRAQERSLTKRLAELQRETDKLESERKTLVEQQQQVMRLDGMAQVARAEHEGAESRRMEAEHQLREAAEAMRICAETRADHDEFLVTEQRTAQARERQQQRSSLREQRADVARDLEGARRDLANAQESLSAAVEAARDLKRLEPQAARQQGLEDERTAARQRVTRRDELASLRVRTERDLEAARQVCVQDERQIAQLEKLRPEADALGERRGQLEQAQAAQATWETKTTRLEAVRVELREKQQQREKVALRETKAATNLRKILAQRDIVDGFAALEAEQKDLDGKMLQVKARIEQNRRSRQQSGMGNCPFLREPCLNIEKRGENSLISYFDRMIASDEQELVPLRQRADELATQVEHARTVLAWWERRGEYEDLQKQAAEDREQIERENSALTDEQRQLQTALANSHDRRALDALRAACEHSETAALQCARLPDLRSHSEEARARRDALANEVERIAAELAGLGSASADLERIEAQLAALGDPRAQVASLRSVVSEHSARAERVQRSQNETRRHEAQLATFDKQLAPFATLDAELDRLEEARARTNAGHMRYLRYEHLAAQHGERKKAQAAAEQQAHAAATRHTKAEREANQARARFDGERLEHVVARGDAVRGEHGQKTEALRTIQEQSERLAREITRIEALLGDLSAARDERQTLDDLGKMLQQFRDIIKEAGPNILKAQLRTISTEANRIFGEILGDRTAELSWEADYEIVLRRDGRERTFAQLSGGEQMSAALAVRLALLRRLSRLDVAFFDEPTQNMDGDRRGNLAEQIRRVRGFDQLLVISHDDTFEQGLDGVIHLDKRNGQTVLDDDETLVPA
jgi:DNA repair protein SbcC/Rad50